MEENQINCSVCVYSFDEPDTDKTVHCVFKRKSVDRNGLCEEIRIL